LGVDMLGHAIPGASNLVTVFNQGPAPPPTDFIPYTNVGTAYNQNFDSLPDPGATSVNADNPVTIDGVTYTPANPFCFAAPVALGGLGLTNLAGWYGLAGASAKFGAQSGDQTTGGDISFGLPGNSNRALGLLATSSTTYTAFGAKFINQTASTLNHINLLATGEVWRQSNLPKTLNCFYLVDPTGTNAFSTNSTAALVSLNVSFPAVPADVGGIAVDGTAAANQTSLALLNQTITNWPPGAALWLVWEMPDATGKAQGLALDNLAFSALSKDLATLAALAPQIAGSNLVLSWSAPAALHYQLQSATN